MTTIQIKQLRLENFKCHRHLVLDFNGGNASIYGDNASGKTSIYDALTWLLFGKDSQGNGEKNIEIKPLNASGEVADHEALTEVEAVLLVNGEELSLRRTLREVWTSKRGSSQLTFDGNTSEYYISGVPCKKNAFTAAVNEIVSEDTFRMLTSVSHFAAGISWQDRRAVLFQVAGVMADSQIMATNDQFKPLADSLGRLSLEDYKKKLLAEKKSFTGTKTSTPDRIDECNKTIQDIEGIDFAGAKAEAEAIRAQVSDLAAKILAAEQNDGVRDKQLELREARLEDSNLEAENHNHRSLQVVGRPDPNQLRRGLNIYSAQIGNKEAQIQRERDYIASLDKQIDQARQDWIAKNGEVFQAENCPTCGQTLPPERQAQAKALFEQNKQRRLQELVIISNHHKLSRKEAEKRITALGQEIENLRQEVAQKQQEITQAEQGQTPVTDLPDYATRKAAVTARIQKISGELMDLQSSAATVTTSLRAQKDKKEARLRELQATISKESLLDYSRKRVEELKEEARNAGAALEAIDNMLFLIEEFTRYKTRFVEDSINGMFRIARFRLFREQANGGVEDRCDVVHEGVPYMNVNNGMKINLGIDIINTLSMAYGVKVPLFVDNAESVTHLETCGSQIIRLVVSEHDKELRVNYGTEN